MGREGHGTSPPLRLTSALLTEGRQTQVQRVHRPRTDVRGAIEDVVGHEVDGPRQVQVVAVPAGPQVTLDTEVPTEVVGRRPDTLRVDVGGRVVRVAGVPTLTVVLACPLVLVDLRRPPTHLNPPPLTAPLTPAETDDRMCRPTSTHPPPPPHTGPPIPGEIGDGMGRPVYSGRPKLLPRLSGRSGPLGRSRGGSHLKVVQGDGSWTSPRLLESTTNICGTNRHQTHQDLPSSPSRVGLSHRWSLLGPHSTRGLRSESPRRWYSVPGLSM